MEAQVTVAERVLRENGNMGSFHSPDAEKCILCGYAKLHRAQLEATTCYSSEETGKHFTLTQLRQLLTSYHQIHNELQQERNLSERNYP